MSIIQNNCLFSVNAFNMTLRKMNEDDLNILCKWRNAPDVLKFMIPNIRTYPLALKMWFKKISENNTSLPYILMHKNEKIGYFELKKIDLSKRICYTATILPKINQFKLYGFYIGLLSEVIIHKLGIVDLYGDIYNFNINSIRRAEAIGYRLFKSGDIISLYIAKHDIRMSSLSNIANKLHVKKEWYKLLGL